jgi:uncharacterized protein YjbI with pentapeptide repeats
MTAIDCIFKKADLSGTDLSESKFTRADLSGAILADARLTNTDFTGATLAGADFSRADLRQAKLTNADVRKARFKDAILSGADLTGAKFDDADFTGANLAGANLTGLDVSKAKNLEQQSPRTVGPNMRELAKAANGSKRFVTSIELELGKDEYVILQTNLSRYGTHVYISGAYNHRSPTNDRATAVNALSLEQCMLDLTDLSSRGAPKFHTVKVDAKQCPLRGKDLQDLATAAWYEACGLDVPSPDELQKAAEQSASDQASLRQTMIAELSGGAAGVAKWNARSEKERSKLGKLRKHDFKNAKLAGVDLQRQDLQGCKFDGANLKGAQLCESQLRGTTFAQADLSGANLARCKCSETSFAEAKLTKCNLRSGSFRCCNFQEADVSESDLRFADVGGADFSTATLDGVEFMMTRFDEKTVFPAGFVPPEGAQVERSRSASRRPAPASTPKVRDAGL